MTQAQPLYCVNKRQRYNAIAIDYATNHLAVRDRGLGHIKSRSHTDKAVYAIEIKLE